MSEQLNSAASVYDFLDRRTQDLVQALTSKGIANMPLAAPRNSVYRAAPGSPVLLYDNEKAFAPTIDEKAASATFIITTPSVDRYGDIVVPRGCLKHIDSFAKNPVGFFSHRSTEMPIGLWQDPQTKTLSLKILDDRIIGTLYFHLATAESEAIFRLVKLGVLKATSIGFLPVKCSIIESRGDKNLPQETEEGEDIIYFKENPAFPGLRFLEWELTETSVVPVGANREALAASLSRGHVEGVKITPALRKSLEPFVLQGRVFSPGFDPAKVKYSGKLKMGKGELEYENGELTKVHGNVISQPTTAQELVDSLAATPAKEFVPVADNKHVEVTRAQRDPSVLDPVRWNRVLSRAFDIQDQKLKPATVEYDFVSRHLKCKVKEIFQTSIAIPAAKIGGFLSAWEKSVLETGRKVADVRNITYDGRETPPVFEMIQLNSKLTKDFLVDGVVFYDGGQSRLVASLSPTWWGLRVTLYTKSDNRDELRSLVNRSWDLVATEFNYLKGEAFSLSGEFLPRTEDTWEGVFLDKKNSATLDSTIKQLNEKGAQFANRGTIFMGPPGTGKTLSGRVIRNDADATFIWVSARDFYRSGAFGGLSYAFELAKELAPAVIFVEDVDNWLDSYSIDMLKTEMDGIGRYAGVWTILTTNFPESLPEALIDRPGRFHDVLLFNLPDATCRKQMLERWLPGLSAADLDNAVKETDTYSGAHIYELAAFAKTLEEQEGIPRSEALCKAIKKVKEQRDLIASTTGRTARRFSKSLGGDTICKYTAALYSPLVLEEKTLSLLTDSQETVTLDLSAMDDTAGGVVTNPTDPVKEDERFDKECLEAVTALQKVLCDHIEWHKTAHSELCASISNLAASNKSLGDLIDKALAESESCRVNTASAEAAYNKAWDEAKEVITSLKGGHDALVNKFLTAYGKRGVK